MKLNLTNLTLSILFVSTFHCTCSTAKAQSPEKRLFKKDTAIQLAAKGHRRRRARRHYCNRSCSPGYKRMKKRWQKVPAIPKPKWRNGYRDLVLYSVNTGVRVRFFPFLPDGELDEEQFDKIETVMADKDTEATHSVHPRLIKLIYKLAVRFKARQINIISGYREPENARGNESHHNDGTAVDLMIPGAGLPGVARVARRFGHVGVGYYPVSGFIHLDVRNGPSYFWVDPSGPGKRPCTRGIMKEYVWKFDSKWDPEKDKPGQVMNKKGEPRGAVKNDEKKKDDSSKQSIQAESAEQPPEKEERTG